MLESFHKYCGEYSLFTAKDKILLATSGGVDSMVMLHLFMQNFSQNIAIAHCNFHLREEQSDADEEFVKATAHDNSINCYTKSFQTEAYAQKNFISIEMAARELRYTWFNTLAEENNFTLIATAHHKNDLAETYLINLMRGTGIKGLISLKPKSSNIIRPILFATRKEIEQFASKNRIKFRTDESNNSDDYLRNKIRHHIIPAFEEISNSFIEKLSDNIDHLTDTYAIYSNAIKHISHKIVSWDGNELLINKAKLIAEQGHKAILFEILQPYGFNSTQLSNILESIHEQPGAQIMSDNYKLYNGREYFHVWDTNIPKKTELFYNIEELCQSTYFKKVEIIPKELFQLNKDVQYGQFDIEKIQFPLIIRQWANGDKIRPLGMRSYKKVSDILTDLKYSQYQKEQTMVLISGEEICWVINVRVADDFKVEPHSKNILTLKR